MFERFTKAAREVVSRAQREARQAGHPTIGTEHLLLALLTEEAGAAYRVLRESGVDEQAARAELARLLRTPSTPLSDEDSAALATIGIDLDAVMARIEEAFGPDALQPPQASSRRSTRGLFGRHAGANPRFSPRLRKVLELSLREAIRLRHNHIGAEHLLLGLLRDGGGRGARMLTASGVNLDDLRCATVAALRTVA